MFPKKSKSKREIKSLKKQKIEIKECQIRTQKEKLG